MLQILHETGESGGVGAPMTTSLVHNGMGKARTHTYRQTNKHAHTRTYTQKLTNVGVFQEAADASFPLQFLMV